MQHQDEIRKKILGCWLGKTVGGVLGTPWESDPRTHALTWYDPMPDQALPNDDLELQVMYLDGLSRMKEPVVNRELLADLWIQHMNFHVQEYGVALCNLRRGISPPWSGLLENHFVDGMGAAIRSELWACLAPGEPDRASIYAREDGCIDHAGEGIHAEVFFAALESLAFVESDLDTLIREALSRIPEESAVAGFIRQVCRWWRESGDWLTVRNRLCDACATEFVSCVLPNVPITVLALLAGGGDFGKTICTAVNCGMDTDCTAATAGAVCGIIAPESISDAWLKPIGRTVVIRPECFPGITPPDTLDELTDAVLRLRSRLKEGRLPEPAPRPEPQLLEIPAEIAVRHAREWWLIPLQGHRWEPLRLPGKYGRIDIERFGEARQLLLRLRFRVEHDGEYHILFNSPTTNHVYLDPDWNRQTPLHDARDMLFGRMRPFLGPEPEGNFPGKAALSCQIFNPYIAGAPLNQIKRYQFLKRGEHELLISFVPCAGDRFIRYGMGIGTPEESAFLPDAFSCR